MWNQCSVNLLAFFVMIYVINNSFLARKFCCMGYDSEHIVYFICYFLFLDLFKVVHAPCSDKNCMIYSHNQLLRYLRPGSGGDTRTMHNYFINTWSLRYYTYTYKRFVLVCYLIIALVAVME